MNNEKKQSEIAELLENIYYELKDIRAEIKKSNTKHTNIDEARIMEREMNNKKERKSEEPELNDYNKIILKNLESRICILEEETQKYKTN